MHTIIAVLLLGILWLPMVSSNRATPVWVEVGAVKVCRLLKQGRRVWPIWTDSGWIVL